MTEHLHSVFVDTCYRCHLSRDEANEQVADRAKELAAFRVRYDDDDNLWWTLTPTDQRDMFDLACDVVDDLRYQLAEALRSSDDLLTPPPST